MHTEKEQLSPVLTWRKQVEIIATTLMNGREFIETGWGKKRLDGVIAMIATCGPIDFVYKD